MTIYEMGWKWKKVDGNVRKWMKEDKRGWKWMKVIESE